MCPLRLPSGGRGSEIAHVALRPALEEVFVAPRLQAVVARVRARTYPGLAAGPAELQAALDLLALAARRLPPRFAMCSWHIVLNS